MSFLNDILDWLQRKTKFGETQQTPQGTEITFNTPQEAEQTATKILTTDEQAKQTVDEFGRPNYEIPYVPPEVIPSMQQPPEPLQTPEEEDYDDSILGITANGETIVARTTASGETSYFAIRPLTLQEAKQALETPTQQAPTPLIRLHAKLNYDSTNQQHTFFSDLSAETVQKPGETNDQTLERLRENLYNRFSAQFGSAVKIWNDDYYEEGTEVIKNHNKNSDHETYEVNYAHHEKQPRKSLFI